jgi:hypothetical protein
VNIPAKLRDRFDRDNAEAAATILADPDRYAGAPLEWARLFVERHPSPGDRCEDRQQRLIALASREAA